MWGKLFKKKTIGFSCDEIADQAVKAAEILTMIENDKENEIGIPFERGESMSSGRDDSHRLRLYKNLLYVKFMKIFDMVTDCHESKVQDSLKIIMFFNNPFVYEMAETNRRKLKKKKSRRLAKAVTTNIQ